MRILRQAVIASAEEERESFRTRDDYRNHRVATIETGRKRNIGFAPSHDGS